MFRSDGIGLASYSGGAFTTTRDTSAPNGLLIGLSNTFSFTIISDGSASGTNGTNAVAVTNGKKLFWIGIVGIAGVRTFEQQ